MPVVAVLGNHDHMSDESPELERRLVPEFLPDWRMAPGEAAVEEIDGGLSLIHFDSTPMDQARTSEERRALRKSLSDAIARAHGPWRILVAHVPLVDTGWSWDVHYRKDVLRAIGDSGVHVHLLLAGHDHNMQAAVEPAPELSLQVVAGSGSGDRDPRLDLLRRSFVLRSPGFARVDLDDQGLVVSLISTAKRPFERWRAPRVEACYRVDPDGRARAIEPMEAGR